MLVNLCHQALHSAGELITCKSVVITTGTFLRGVVHVGRKTKAAGRMPSSITEVFKSDLQSFSCMPELRCHGLVRLHPYMAESIACVLLCHACDALLCVLHYPVTLDHIILLHLLHCFGLHRCLVVSVLFTQPHGLAPCGIQLIYGAFSKRRCLVLLHTTYICAFKPGCPTSHN